MISLLVIFLTASAPHRVHHFYANGVLAQYKLTELCAADHPHDHSHGHADQQNHSNAHRLQEPTPTKLNAQEKSVEGKPQLAQRQK